MFPQPTVTEIGAAVVVRFPCFMTCMYVCMYVCMHVLHNVCSECTGVHMFDCSLNDCGSSGPTDLVVDKSHLTKTGKSLTACRFLLERRKSFLTCYKLLESHCYFQKSISTTHQLPVPKLPGEAIKELIWSI